MLFRSCKMNCTFCQTGKQGFQGNLHVADILNQIYTVNRMQTRTDGSGALTNIVFMGQGEPLDNFDALLRSIALLQADYGWAWSPRRITVSTIGLKKNLKRFVEECDSHLAVSLHFPLHEQRLQYMPAERQFPIEEVVGLLMQYDWSHQRRLSFEYTMFEGVNDSTVFAKELIHLVGQLDCRVNLIPYHHVEGVELSPTSMQRMVAFRDYLTRRGVYTTIRSSRGQDIDAACGLLSTKQQQQP